MAITIPLDQRRALTTTEVKAHIEQINSPNPDQLIKYMCESGCFTQTEFESKVYFNFEALESKPSILEEIVSQMLAASRIREQTDAGNLIATGVIAPDNAFLLGVIITRRLMELYRSKYPEHRFGWFGDPFSKDLGVIWDEEEKSLVPYRDNVIVVNSLVAIGTKCNSVINKVRQTGSMVTRTVSFASVAKPHLNICPDRVSSLVILKDIVGDYGWYTKGDIPA